MLADQGGLAGALCGPEREMYRLAGDAKRGLDQKPLLVYGRVCDDYGALTVEVQRIISLGEGAVSL